MKRMQILGISLILVLLLGACAPAAPAKPAAPVKAAWEVGWEKTLEAAKQEGVVAFVCSAGRDVTVGLTEGFRDKFGIRAEGTAGTVGALSSKILAERRAGLYLWDVMIGGASGQMSVFKPGGGTSPLEPALILPELTDPEVIKKVWYGGKLPWVDKDRHVLAPLVYTEAYIMVNTNLVKLGEIKVWDDLLAPKWKGKILLMNPALAGTKADGSLMLFLYDYKGEDWVRKLATQEPVLIADDRLGVDWLAHGKYPVFLPPRQEAFQTHMQAGAPVQIVITEDMNGLESGASGVSWIDRSPHPNAAKAFINFYLSKEGQTILSQNWGVPSGRLDVTTEGLPAWSLVKPGGKYWIKTREEVLLKAADWRTKSKEIFGPYIK